MALLELKCKTLLLGLNDTVLVNNLEDNSSLEINIPKSVKNKEDNTENICVIAISENCDYLSVVTDKKILLIYSKVDSKYECTNIHSLSRAVSSIKFSKTSNKLIIADKTGDIYIAEKNSDWLPNLALGHLSMLLDVLITPDDKCIISCDRDEKIRVSSYPDTFNIVAYCLGHEEFVSVLDMINEYPDILFSASGDATFRIWHYPTGKQLLCAKLSEPIVGMRVTKTEGNILAISSLYKSCDVIICSVSFTNRNCVECKNIQTVRLTAIPTKFTTFKNSLWFIDNNELIEYIFNANSLLYVKNYQRPANICSAASELLVQNKNSNALDFITSLFKKQYNNIEEYHNKKKIRLNKTISNSIKT